MGYRKFVVVEGNMYVKPEEEVDTDEKGPYILQSVVDKAVKEMRNTYIQDIINITTRVELKTKWE